MKNIIKDNWFKLVLVIFIVAIFIPLPSKAFLDCSQYGLMAYADYSGYCKCMSGYIWGKSFMGQPYCVSGSSYCYDNYGLGSEYDSYSNSCKCSSGYVWDNTFTGSRCVSCSEKYGIGAMSDYSSGGCKCMSGYIMNSDSYGNQRCLDGNQACRSKFGLYSSYNSSTNKCECYAGYTFNSENQCAEKQNNVYYKLIELDTAAKKAVIKSDYGGGYYSIEYGFGCFSGTFSRYLNKNIVINLGTNLRIERYDKVVLQDDNETCDITNIVMVDSNFFLVKKEIGVNFQTNNTECPLNSYLYNNTCYCNQGYITSADKTECIKQIQYVVVNNTINLREKASTSSRVIGQLKKNIKYEIIDLSNKDWVKIKFGNKNGWVSKKLVSIK
ncbi:MAG: SH3 domain-containing protein [Candidatus Falkowbacteria bacterium]|nr:SH3 domain-containing protein [Candidatus Falkowbacteria bacterium]